MVKVFGGAALVIAGIAAFIEAHSHRPPKGGEWVPSLGGRTWWLSQTAYDLLRIGGAALILVGALLIIVGLIRYVRETRPA